MSTQPPDPWTPAQWEAITRSGADLLVAAAAGSGKTAVLVERIIRKITAQDDPVDVDRLLVVTFTDAAADEMRRRIGDALQRLLDDNPGDERLRRQLALLPRASISTLHSFCRSVLREYFYRAGLDPRFRVADEHEALMLRHDALDAVLDAAYAAAQPGDAFSLLAAATAGPEGDEKLRHLVMALYERARSLPDPIGWLRRLPGLPWDDDDGGTPEELLDRAPWQGDLRRWIRLRVASARVLLEQARELAMGPGGVAGYVPALEEQLEGLETLRDRLDRPFGQLREAFLNFALPGLPRARPGEGDPAVRKAVQDMRRKAQDRIAAVRDLVFAPPPRVHVEELRRAVPYIEALVDLTVAFHGEYARLKEARAVLDFADLEHRCLALLKGDPTDPPAPSGSPEPSPVARELRARFVEVLVDEYQDTNPVQDAILQHIASGGDSGSGEYNGQGGDGVPSLFAVGDVKQSIYRFRLADPTLFLERYARSLPLVPGSPEEWLAAVDAALQGLRIDLNANFRSRRSVVDAVNYVFRTVMVPEVGEMAYDDGAALVCAARYPDDPAPGGAAGDAPVEFHLLEREAGDGGDDGADDPDATGEDDPEDLSALEQEALIAAQRIRELAGLDPDGGPPVHVWDKALEAYRPLRLGDVTVLLRATRTKANALVDMLGRLGIPAYADLGTGYFAATEVETMLALLAVIDNPRQDIPLAAVLRSPLVGVGDADLARIRLRGGTGSGPGRFYDAVRAVANLADAGPTAGDSTDAGPGDTDFTVAGEDGPADPGSEEIHLARRLRAFLEQLDRWRTAARRGPLGDLIQDIYRTTRYDQYVGALPGGRQRQANLRTLYERARQFDTFHRQGLSRFLRFIRRLQQAEGDLGAAPAAPEDDNAVRVMSVHRSKGLEFPVVILLDVGRPFNRPRGEGGLFLFHRAAGAAMMAIDEERWSAHPSLPFLAMQERIRQEELAEEMRILYVALTRARERLIVIGSVAGVPRACAGWLRTASSADPEAPLPTEPLAQAASWLDWIGPALCRHRGGQPLREAAARHRQGAPEADGPAFPVASDTAPWRVILWEADNLPRLTSGDEAHPPPIPWARLAAGEPLPMDQAPRLPAALEERLAWRYPAAPLSGRAAKVTVSDLKRLWEADDEGESMLLTWQVAAPFRRRFRRQREGPAPLTAAEKGTAVHLVLQLLDLAEPLDRDGIARQVERLQAEGRLTPEQAAAVDCGMLAAFFAGPLGRRLQAAGPALMREVPFSLALPAREVYPDLHGPEVDGEYVLTQGIIDVMAPLDEGIVLVDFKTDRVEPGAARTAARRYRTQMALYERAVREIFGRPAAEVYIVFLSSGEAVRVR